MSLIDKLTQEHFAWFDKEIATDYGNAPQEATKPLDIFEKKVLKYKLKNHLPLKTNIDIVDVFFEDEHIGVDKYYQLSKSFCDLNLKKEFSIINGVKRWTGIK